MQSTHHVVIIATITPCERFLLVVHNTTEARHDGHVMPISVRHPRLIAVSGPGAAAVKGAEMEPGSRREGHIHGAAQPTVIAEH